MFLRKEIIGDATLYLGDCREMLDELQGADAVIPDPPYGIAFSHSGMGQGNFRKSAEVYRAKFGKIKIHGDDAPFDPQFLLLLAPVVLLWGANHYADKLPASPNWLIWDKVTVAESYGKWSFADCEMAWCNRKGAARLIRHLWNGARRAGEERSKAGGEGRVHAMQKPVAVMRRCIEICGMPETIVDPYMGSGTTGVAAINLGKKFIGVEIDEGYFDIACERIRNAMRQTSLLPVHQDQASPLVQSSFL